jgi:Ca2+/H+ antiporter, TMEM165/GDT1 family
VCHFRSGSLAERGHQAGGTRQARAAIVIANLAARYHDPVAVGIGSVLALWSVVALALVGGRRLQRILPLRWITRLAAPAMVIKAGFTLAEALR